MVVKHTHLLYRLVDFKTCVLHALSCQLFFSVRRVKSSRVKSERSDDKKGTGLGGSAAQKRPRDPLADSPC